LIPNGEKGIFLGFNFSSHCYIIKDYNDFSLHKVRETVFDEESHAYLTLPMETITWKSYTTDTLIFTNDSDNPRLILSS